jgi:hypothetical protein
MKWFLRCLLFLALTAVTASAHIGSPNVFFEGNAGSYPVRIVLRPPEVIPGQAQISARVQTNGVERVTVLPMRWNSGKQGSPRPDEATAVRGETNLFSAELWFMVGGAQSVEVEVRGAHGRGRVIVPVNIVATRVTQMPKQLGTALAGLGALLVVLAIGIVSGGTREAVLAAGETPSRKRIWLSRGMAAVSFTSIIAAIYFGKNWWEKEAGDYRNNRLFRPVETTAEVHGDKLRLAFGVNLLRRNGPLVPDHGKLMHLFLVREPAMDVFAHLHPVKVDWHTFEMSLPSLPPGDYKVYGDVTYETGFSDTLTASVSLPQGVAGANRLDADDGVRVSGAFNTAATSQSKISTNLVLARLSDAPFVENRDTQLRFALRDSTGRAILPEPYMGMAAHLILRRDDGSVFTHLHPSGSFSMAAKQLFDLRDEGKLPMKIASYTNEPICKVPLLASTAAASEISFPYAFPKAGNYRLWVQTKVAGEVRTGVFDVAVAAAR